MVPLATFAFAALALGRLRRGFLSFVWWLTTPQQNLYQRLSRGSMDGEALHEAWRGPGGARFPKDMVAPHRPASKWIVSTSHGQ